MQRGLRDCKSDSHRLSGLGSSHRAPGVRFSISNFQSLITSTMGIASLLLPVRDGSLAGASGGPRFEPRLSHGCVQLFVSNSLGSFLRFLVSETVHLDVIFADPLGTHQLSWTLRADRTMYVANAGGTQRVNPVQVIFGRGCPRLVVRGPVGARRFGSLKIAAGKYALSLAQLGKWIEDVRLGATLGSA